jgi:hypothetical protein
MTVGCLNKYCNSILGTDEQYCKVCEDCLEKLLCCTSVSATEKRWINNYFSGKGNAVKVGNLKSDLDELLKRNFPIFLTSNFQRSKP